MILEKIKQHSGKISFFAISILLVAVGALYLNQKNLKTAARASATNTYSTQATTTNANAYQTPTKPSTTTKPSTAPKPATTSYVS